MERQTNRLTPEEIRSLRLSMNLSQVQLAEYFDVNFRTIGNWESGFTKPTDLQDAVLRQMKNRVTQIEDPLERYNFADKLLATALGAGGILLALHLIFKTSDDE